MIRSKGSILLLLIVLFVCSNRLSAQAPNAAFRNITAADGLPQTSVTAVTQDAFGLIWIATWDGVYRYDGNSFARISSVDARRITADKRGGVWISTSRGRSILYYSTHADSIKQYNIAAGGGITTIRVDDAGNVWAGTTNGLLKYDIGSDTFKPAIENFNKQIFRVLARGDGELLFIYRDENIKQSKIGYRSANGNYHFEALPFDKNNPVQGKTFIDKYPPFGMAFKDSGFIMFNNYGWAYKTTPSGEWNFSKPTNNETIEDFNDLVIDANNNVWLSQLTSLQKINLETGHSVLYRNKEGDNASLLTLSGLGTGTSLFIDRQGVLWAPRYGTGISRLNLYENDFGLMKDEQGKVILDVLSAVELKDGSFFIGSRTEDKGLYHFSADKKLLQRYGSGSFKSPPGKTISNELSHPFPWSLSADDYGNVWVGTGWPTKGDGGLNLLKPESSIITRYKHDSTDSNSIPDDWIRKIVQRQDGKLWVVATSAAWFLFDPEKEIAYTADENKARWSWGNSLITNSGDLIYEHTILSQNRGLEQTGKYFRINGATLQPDSLKVDWGGLRNIRLAFEDSAGRIWFTKNRGFGYLNEQHQKVAWFYDIRENKLPANEISGILFDNRGKLWLTTDNGLIRFDTATNRYNHYGIERGLQGNYFDKIYKGPSGRLYLGGNGGINVFDPEEILTNPFSPQMVFTGLKLDGEEIQFGKESAITEPIIVAEKITVGPDVSVISLDFAVIHFAGNSNNQYQYRLEGFDKDWRDGGKVGNAAYTNLSPGKYTLYIRGMNWDGVWSDGTKSISIRIMPPWYRTWWAYSIYGLLFLFVLWLVHRFQKIKTIRKERERAQQKELQQAKEIEKAYTELKTTQAQLIQSEKMASLGELTAGIAHEIQNPLNFVNNFSEVSSELMEEMEQEIDRGDFEEVKTIASDIKSNLIKINHHGKRADAIVKGMLEHSRVSHGEKVETNINALCDEYLRLCYHGLRAKDKSFNSAFETYFDTKLPKINVVSQDIGRVLLNLINNAFYAVSEKLKVESQKSGSGYEPTVSITTQLTANGLLLISIKDNGSGIPEHIKDKIFQPFFTTKPTGQGTGLGLSLSYDIVKAHNGTLKVESEKGKGTEFIIQLPITLTTN